MNPLGTGFCGSARPVAAINVVIKASCAHFCCCQQSTTGLGVFTVVTQCGASVRGERAKATDKSERATVFL